MQMEVPLNQIENIWFRITSTVKVNFSRDREEIPLAEKSLAVSVKLFYLRRKISRIVLCGNFCEKKRIKFDI